MTDDEKLVSEAGAAVQYAQSVRQLHRRRTRKGADQRERDIKWALERLKTAMTPIRSRVARFPYEPQTVNAETRRQQIRDSSAAIQTERRKLWKMQKHA